MHYNSFKIFRSGSVTFFTASLFFPKKFRKDIFDLYAFVRKFDDFVDKQPQDKQSYLAWKKNYITSLDGKVTGNQVVDNFVSLSKKCQFENSWVEEFFRSMEMDLDGYVYRTLEDTKLYMRGSAEVVGLMMARILELPKESYLYAELLGRAFQYMNMIRDIAEDQSILRQYIPQEYLDKFGLKNLSFAEVKSHPEEFKKLIHQEIDRYFLWQAEASKGLKFMPKSVIVPIKSAMDLFNQTMLQIRKDPLIVYSTQLKPSYKKAFGAVIKNLLS